MLIFAYLLFGILLVSQVRPAMWWQALALVLFWPLVVLAAIVKG